MLMKNNRGSLYAFWSIAILLCLIISIFSVIFASCSGGKAEKAPVGTREPVNTEEPADTDEPGGGDEGQQ